MASEFWSDWCLFIKLITLLRSTSLSRATVKSEPVSPNLPALQRVATQSILSQGDGSKMSQQVSLLFIANMQLR